ncbi:hypothetical protein HPB51_028595 [Rhipicephalus microplus]|uniref:Uncharacterized protein n=1 Tax=Rhipicephalus microplus TaxID=6941 RepID=A0A9J6CWG7_RHIMP|nr:hypothetical protein HPB51_028595 [Rhipicephalus microplus]
MVNNRVKSPSNASGHIGRELTMDNFQDGGTHQLNARPSAVAGDPAAFAIDSDSFRLPSLQSEPEGFCDGRRGVPNSPDGMNHVPVPGYGTGYADRGGYMASQHGGPNLPGNANDPAQSKLYQHYNQQHMRPGYPQGPRAAMGPMGDRSGRAP